MAAMKQEKTVWMKTEEADVVPNAPGLMVQPYPPSVYVKEEMEDGGYEEFSEDPLRTEEAHLHMKQEPQLKLDVDGSQCNVQPYPHSVYVKEEMEDGGYEEFNEDPLRTEEAHLHMKQEPQLKLDVDGSQCNVQPYPHSVYVKEEMEDGGYEEFNEDPLRTEEAHLHMKQEPQLKLDVDGSQCNVQPYPPSVYVKEEMEDGGYEEFSEDPLRTEEAHIHIKQEPQLKLDVDGSQCNFLCDPLGGYWSTDNLNGDSRLNFGWDENENNNAVLTTLLHTILEAESECCPPPLLVPEKELFPDDTLGISWLSDFIKEDPELNLEADETENIVVASTSYASNMMRLTGDMAESSDISYEETINQDSDNSTSFAMFFEEQERLFGTRLKCSLSENICHTFSCSFCLQSFPSKYGLIMHVFVHIDGVHPPRFVCKSCGEVFPSHASLNKHLKMSEINQALSADNSEKFHFSCDCRSSFFEAYQEDVIEQTETQCSSKQPCSDIQFNDTSITHTLTHNAEIRHRHDNDGTSNTTGNFNAHTVLLPEKRRLNCVVSGKSFTKVGSLKRNAIIHTGPQLHTCHICGKSFTQLSNDKTHALIHTGIKHHKCDICGKSFIQLGHLQRHTLIHRGRRPYKCEFCFESFTLREDLKKHTCIHTGKLPHKCGICGKSFTRVGALKRHTLIHPGTLLHKCDICGKSFILLDSLNKHALIHTETKRYKCGICGKSFSRAAGLKCHALIHTGTRPHKCDICGKSFTLVGARNRHALIHTGERPHKCHICGKSFRLLDYLKIHALIHTGTKPHKCDICRKSFTQLSSLKAHKLLHTGMRPHKCDICGISFTQLSNLKSHALIHTGIKPHKCNICEKSFTQLSALKSHALKHTGLKPHKCNICEKSFRLSGALRRHALIHT